MNHYNCASNSIVDIINPQYVTGCNFGRQRIYVEQINNMWAAAMQCYDLAIACIDQLLALAQQSGMSFYSQVYYDLALAHSISARVKPIFSSHFPHIT